MSTTTAPERRRSGRVPLVIVTVLSIAIVGYFVPPYLGLNPDESRVGIRADVPFQFPVLVVHVVTAGLALLIGPMQFSTWLRRRVPRLHRSLGRTYLLAGVLPGGLAGMVVAVLTTAGPVAATSFVVLDCWWLTTAIAGWRAARAHRYADHQRWMRRNFALTFGAVMLRAWLGVLIVAQLPLLGPVYHYDFDSLFEVAYVASSILGWVPNALFIEWYLRRRSAHPQTWSPSTPAVRSIGA